MPPKDRSLLEHEAVARIKICNFVDLDPVKLREAAQNEGYREPVYKGHPLKATLLLDSENIVQLRLDLEKFVLGCEIYPFRKSCIEVFHWQLDSFGVCYVGELNIHATRKETPLLIDFYFDPELSRMNNISGPFPTSQRFLKDLSLLMGIATTHIKRQLLSIIFKTFPVIRFNFLT